MERAGIILLLISADFLASEYCYNIELPFALKRHQAGSAIVSTRAAPAGGMEGYAIRGFAGLA